MVDLSIIIPAYNMEKYILRAINSALMQNGIEIEIIVVNDGSSDSTRFIAEDIQSIDKRVKLIIPPSFFLSWVISSYKVS